MGNKKKRHFQGILCGMLCSAMIATSLIVPDMTAYASPADEMLSAETADNGGQNGEDLKIEGEGLKETPGDEDDSKNEGNVIEDGSDGDSDGSGDGGSGNGTGDGSEDDGNKGDGSDSDFGDDKNKDEVDNEDDVDNKNDNDTDDGVDVKDGLELDKEETESELMSVWSARAVTASNGSLQNGDFEEADEDNQYTPAVWSAAYDNNGTYYEYKTSGGNSDCYVESKWNDDSETTFSISQVIENFPEGNYTLSVDIQGNYEENTVYAKVEKVTKSGEEYAASGDPLLSESLGSNSAWTWNKTFTSQKITVPADAGAIRVSFEGTLGNGKQIKLDNVKLEEAPDVTEKMFYFHYAPGEGETAPLSLGVELWSNTGGSITTSIADKVGDYFVMSPVEGYVDWYQIPLAVVDEVTGDGSKAGINIYKEPSSGTADRIAQFDGWNNKSIYELLLADDTKACAVKNGKGYVDNGTDKLAAAIMRNITFHVYSEGDTPCLQMSGDGLVTAALSRVDEESEGRVPLTPAAENIDGNVGYELERRKYELVFDHFFCARHTNIWREHNRRKNMQSVLWQHI